VVGKPIGIAGRTFTIVGVAAPGFRGHAPGAGGANGPEVFAPLGKTSPDDLPVSIIARLNSTASVNAARAYVGLLGARVSSKEAAREHRVLRAYPAGLDWGQTPVDAALSLALYLVIPLAILGIGCANVVSLQLARSTERSRELGVRLALGASRAQVWKLIGLEVAFLAVVAGALGLAGARALLALTSGLVRWPLEIDVRVAMFLLVLVLGVIGVCGFAPSWLAVRDLTAVGLRASTSTVSHRRLRGLLVILQIGCSVVLVYLTTLGLNAVIANGARIPESAADVVVADVLLDTTTRSDTRRRSILDEIAERAQQGERRSVAISSALLDGTARSFRLDNEQTRSARSAYVNRVSASWFTVVGARVLAGRTFTDDDGGRGVAISQTLARSIGGASAVGRRVRLGDPQAPEQERVVLGVVEDGMSGPSPVMYTPMPEVPPASVFVLARAADGPAVATERLRQAIRAVTSEIPADRIDTLQSRLAQATNGASYLTSIGSALSSLAVMLAALGLFAVMSYAVQKRAPEIGIRRAIGASAPHILLLVAGEAWWIVVSGVLLGLACALPMGYAMRSALFGVSFIGPSAVLPVAAVFLCVAAVAAAGPCLKALSVDPMATLRDE
jgi:predicted permease